MDSVPPVGDSGLAAHLKLVTLGVAAEIIVVVEHKYAGVRMRLAVEIRRRSGR